LVKKTLAENCFCCGNLNPFFKHLLAETFQRWKVAQLSNNKDIFVAPEVCNLCVTLLNLILFGEILGLF